MKKILSLLALLFVSTNLLAQQTVDETPTMADAFRADGKIYVVIAVMAIILVGLFIYLFMIGNKISSLEKKLKENS